MNLKAALTEHEQILVPGRGFINLRAEAVSRALEKEDDRLRFGYNPANQDWVVYIRMPRQFDAVYFIDGDPVYPILGFGERIPEPAEAVDRLQRADTRRHGMSILNVMNKQNAQLQAQAARAQDEAMGETADRIEFTARKDGLTEKYTKSTRKIPKGG